MMYQREECLAQASVCRERAQSDPVHYDFWIDEAIVWLQRAIGASHHNAVAHGVDDGRMIPRRLH
jgi:hypothetical protein